MRGLKSALTIQHCRRSLNGRLGKHRDSTIRFGSSDGHARNLRRMSTQVKALELYTAALADTAQKVERTISLLQTWPNTGVGKTGSGGI